MQIGSPWIYDSEWIDQHRIMLNEIGHDFFGVGVHQGMFKELRRATFAGNYLLILFYPLDFCTIFPSVLDNVPNPMLKVSKVWEEFKQHLGCDIMLVSTDSSYTHLAYSKTDVREGGINCNGIYLFSDTEGHLSKSWCAQ